MYSFKRIILRLLEIYHNNNSNNNGRAKFFNAWGIAYIYNYLVNNKKYDFGEIRKRNYIFYLWRKDPEKYEIPIQKQIEDDYNFIISVLDTIKDEAIKQEEDYYINRKKIAGCVGTVVY